MKGSETFGDLASRGKFLMSKIRESGWSPRYQKQLRKFGASEAARMLGKSRETIRKHESEGNLPQPEKINGFKVYTLDQINHMRDFFDVRPINKTKRAAVIAVDNSKGGVTKSTSTTHAAQDFALAGYRVLLIDGDHQGSATMNMGFAPREDISPNETLLPFFRKPIEGMSSPDAHHYTNSLKPLIKKTYFPGIDIIPANLSLYNIFLETTALFVNAAISGVKFDHHDILHEGIFGTDTIEGIANDYDIILIDCPPYIDTLTFNALYAADGIIIPVPPIMTDVSSTVEFFEMSHDIFSEYPDREYAFIKLLVTKHKPPGENQDPESEANHNSQIARLIKHFFEDKVLVNTMIASEAVEKTSTQLKTIYDMSPQEFATSLHADRKTLKRALEAAKKVNAEILELINDFRESLPKIKVPDEVGEVA